MTPAPESREALALTVEQLGADLDASDCEEGGRAEVLYEVAEELRALEKRCGELEARCARAETEAAHLAHEGRELEAERDALRSALTGLMGIVDDSNGVAGYHLNGDIATWALEFKDEVEAAERALTKGAEVRDHGG